MMFGDVGRLNGFLGLVPNAIFGFLSESFLQAKMISTFFFTTKSKLEQVHSSKELYRVNW